MVGPGSADEGSRRPLIMTVPKWIAGSRLGVALGLMLLASQLPAGAQTFNYLAFGDSITCGKFDGNLCNIPGTGVDPTTSPAGYPGRLRTQLSCTGGGSSCQVHNHGKPGESTSQGLTRIDGILNGQDFDILLLMHGTNDVFANVSRTTITDNLQLMDDKATNKGVDTLYGSLIRFHPDGLGWTSNREAKIKGIKDDLISIAATRNRYFANPWSVLCPNQGCFNSNYANLAADPNGLHPDASGYDLLADEFEDSIEQNPAPSVPTAQSPSGDTGSTTVTWTESSNATWYQVEWDAGGGSKWVQSDDACSGGTCNYTIPGLGPSGHSWKVRSRNPLARSGWSATLNFTLFTSPPNAATAISPTGNFFTTPPAEFRWSDEGAATNGATRYQLQIDREGVTVFDQDVVPTCAANECSYDPSLVWSAGNYSWQVRAENLAGESAWSNTLQFLYTDAVPAKPTLFHPTMDTFDTTPLFSWSGEFAAEQYRIQVFNNSAAKVLDEFLNTTTVCSEGTCTYSPVTTLAAEGHTWKVRGINPVGPGLFSATQVFTVLDCSAFPDLDLQSVDGPVTGVELRAACDTITASNGYTVQGPSGDLQLHAGAKIALNDGFSVESDGSLSCRIDP